MIHKLINKSVDKSCNNKCKINKKKGERHEKVFVFLCIFRFQRLGFDKLIKLEIQ